MKEHDEDRLMTRKEVEERFAITKRFLELSAMRGGGPRLVRVGRLVRYRVKDIQAWIESRATKGEPK
ncbi:helix-turn-helix transcriptional regulator [Neotabrizicola sp. sgz301269]|uniref:helix-turn-helix transcriptional regulator n=1 Tax=Neotabrizicola sp. sgz301269 TaxID=3276282 RepID=UPI003770157A